ncbi:lytic polysaccharide monooxygenase auxiliary activity family 9 protein [Actinomadura fibrosa]|uniref:Lytic polysaccharide monooxygenase auxiliary activity family 9 protein n=1 Tax=Actinomadura fibrosa TaxID=111802 RepID=A0ABW2XNF3_9ACTN|nr:lytic polysaccharide monooxygenase auxiliary activity family 9 protein [Actinomadura fibrosa]
MNKRLIAAVSGAALAPAFVVVLAGAASAHGYINSPPSRQAQCAQRTVQCGDIKYEPQSVEGPKGLRSCSGGNARFAELDNDALGWRATPVGRTATFRWTFTAAHRTSNWQYYIGNTLLKEVSGNDAQPPSTVSHTVNLGNVSGRQKLLAVWNIADTTNAFYACVDLQVG